MRDIWSVSNQLGGYIGPDTEERLAQFLWRESNEAAKLAQMVLDLQKENAILRTEISEYKEGWNEKPNL